MLFTVVFSFEKYLLCCPSLKPYTLTDLMNCQMRGWNGWEVVKLLVMEHFSKFMAVVETLNQETPYATDICALYQGVWYTELKHFTNAEDYAVPPRPVGETNAAAHIRLQQAWDAVHHFEQKLGLLCSMGKATALQWGTTFH